MEDQHNLWHNDLNTNRDHLLIEDYRSTKLEVSRAQGMGYQHDLQPWPLTWISIRITYSLRTTCIYLASLNVLGQSIDLWVAQGYASTWSLNKSFGLLTGISLEIIYSKRYVTYKIWGLWNKAFLGYLSHKVKGDRHTNRSTYLPTKLHVQRNMPLLRIIINYN